MVLPYIVPVPYVAAVGLVPVVVVRCVVRGQAGYPGIFFQLVWIAFAVGNAFDLAGRAMNHRGHPFEATWSSGDPLVVLGVSSMLIGAATVPVVGYMVVKHARARVALAKSRRQVAAL